MLGKFAGGKAVTASLLFLLFISHLNAQITWAGLSTYGGGSRDEMMSLVFRGSTPVLLLSTVSFSISGVDEDFALITPSWTKVVGQTGIDIGAFKVVWQTTGNITVGGAYCSDLGFGDASCAPPVIGFLTQLSPSGTFLRGVNFDPANNWGTCTGSSSRETIIFSVSPTNDGGIVAGGYLTYNEIDSWGICSPLERDAFIAKFDSTLNLQWIKPVGIRYNGRDEIATTALQTSDGNYVLIGPSYNEIWIGKFDTSGNLIWQRRYPRPFYDSGIGLYISWGKATSDGGFILADEISGGTNRDALFVKFDPLGNIQYAKRLSTAGDDVGIDVVEGPNYYWMTGILNSSDIFIAAFDKSTGDLVNFRYLLSGGNELVNSIDLSPSGIPWVAGYTDNAAWSAGGLDGLVAADTGVVDTCYWRSYPISVSDVTLTNSGSWTLYSYTYIPPSLSFNVQDVVISPNIICGLPLGPGDDSELSVSERYVDCTLNYFLVGNELRIRVKGKTDLDINLYTVDGRKLFSKHLEGFSGIYRVPVKLEKGVYMLDLKHGGGRTAQKVVVK